MANNNNKEKYLLDSIIYKAPTLSDNPKEYISSIDSSGLPKVEYIMNKYRSSTIEYVVENPPPKLIVNEIKRNNSNGINNNNNNNNKQSNDNNKNNHINNKNNSINNQNHNIIPSKTNSISTTTTTTTTTKPRSVSMPPQLKDLPCHNCKKMVPIDNLQPCDRCGNGCYCSDDCQYANWVIHKKKCKNLGMVIKMKRHYSL